MGLVGEVDVRRAGIRVGVHRDRPVAETVNGADRPSGDLSTVGDQNCRLMIVD
jgi:hypothetical protein